jgi:hypothetical protein
MEKIETTMVFSTIKPYTNAKGVSHDAHFNANGKYIGSVKKLGTKPLEEKKEQKEPKVVEAVAVEYDGLIQQIIYLQLENQELREKNKKL